jgi:hypothetical protein
MVPDPMHLGDGGDREIRGDGETPKAMRRRIKVFGMMVLLMIDIHGDKVGVEFYHLGISFEKQKLIFN